MRSRNQRLGDLVIGNREVERQRSHHVSIPSLDSAGIISKDQSNLLVGLYGILSSLLENIKSIRSGDTSGRLDVIVLLVDEFFLVEAHDIVHETRPCRHLRECLKLVSQYASREGRDEEITDLDILGRVRVNILGERSPSVETTHSREVPDESWEHGSVLAQLSIGAHSTGLNESTLHECNGADDHLVSDDFIIVLD